MASSSDWITALLERPQEDVSSPAPLSWLPDFAKPQEGFVESLPFERPASEPEPESEPQHEPVDLPEVSVGDELEDILRKALADQEAAEVPQAARPNTPELVPEPPPEAIPDPDPIAEAFAQGEAAGRQVAMAEQQALGEQRLRLRQSFHALDQAAMDALASDLAETVIALCCQTLADFIPAPDALRTRCLEAARRLGSGPGSGAVSGAGAVTLYLHPDDLALMDTDGLEGWRIIGDPAAERGGLRFETADGSVSDRPADWRRAIAAAIKG